MFNRGNVHASIAPGGKAYMEVRVVNNGYQTWTNSVVHLGTAKSNDRCSGFADATWMSCQRIAMKETSVMPGDIATFDFTITAPQTTGSFRENFNVVADGYTWMYGPSLYFDLDVVPPQQASSAANTMTGGTKLTPGSRLLSPDLHGAFEQQNDGNTVLYIDGKPLWSTSTYGYKIRDLSMQADGNLVLYGKDNVPDWSSGTAGNPGAYLVFQTDGNMVIYGSGGQALWSSGTSGRPDGLNYVTHSISSTAVLQPMQQLRTASGSYKLIMQSDGNVVAYSANRAIWSSGTFGKSVGHMYMQGDGNLVIYSTTGQALWSSGTAGQGPSTLTMQDDGNLVIYNQLGRATWSSGTAGAQ
jgi:hypothetical protein